MSLNLSTGDGDFTPFIKYNAKAGRWFARNDSGEDVEIQNPSFAIDFANIRTGWINFPQSGAPVCIWDVENVRAPKPDPNYKDGFEVCLFGTEPQQNLGGKPLGIRQWMSSAGTAKTAIVDAHAQYEQGKEPGKVPVFECTGVEIVPSAYGDNYKPTLALKSWVDRAQIPEFDEAVARQTPSHVPAAKNDQPMPALQNGDPGPQGETDYGNRRF